MPVALQITAYPLWGLVAVFVLAAIAICIAGTRLSYVADELADRTGLGEVIAGALFVGAATSLPGAITSVSTAMQGQPELAIGNALGGLTAQTAFVAVADIAYRRANLEHAAASVTGLAQGILMVIMLTIPLLASAESDITIWRIHPATLAIPITYIFGLRLLWQIQKNPMWIPKDTDETEEALSDVDPIEGRMSRLWRDFAILAGITAVAGFAIGQASIGLLDKTSMGAGPVGSIFAAVANSLPELVTAIAAVRAGAVSLAIGNIIGGNAFEVMFLAAADVAYDGSLYAEMTAANRSTALIALLMTGVLLLGLVKRDREGPATIGFESVTVLALYALSVVLIIT